MELNSKKLKIVSILIVKTSWKATKPDWHEIMYFTPYQQIFTHLMSELGSTSMNWKYSYVNFRMDKGVAVLSILNQNLTIVFNFNYTLLKKYLDSVSDFVLVY